MRALALVITVCTGFAGLVYEVTWQKYLAVLLGSHSEATAAVLGIFLAGLSVGYELFGSMTRRRVADARAGDRSANLLRLYALLEGGVGVHALLFPWLFAGARYLSLASPLGSEGWGFAFDVALTAVLLGPAAVLMGGTIPILTQALARDLEDATRVHAWVYGFNTAGAFGGALAAGFVLVPLLGLPDTLAAMSIVNLSAAAVFWWLDRKSALPDQVSGPDTHTEPADDTAGNLLPSSAGYAVVAGLTGFAMMVFQTVANRLAALSLGGSPFTFSMVVAVFVLCIALGSMSVSMVRRVGRLLPLANQSLLTVLVLILYFVADTSPYWAQVVRSGFDSTDADFTPYYLASFGWMLVALGVPVLLSGAALPLLFHHARRASKDLGAVAGRLYAWNTAGSLAGALLGGYALLFWFDLHAVYRVGVLALVASVGVLAWLAGGRVRTVGVAAALIGTLVLPQLSGWDPELLASGLFRHRMALPATDQGPLATARSVRSGAKLIFHADDPAVTVTVNEWRLQDRGLIRSLLSNGKPDGTTDGDYETMALAGLIPALLSEKAERAFVIGWGTGITVGELANLSSMREVTVAEISPAVLEAAPLFDFASLGASRHPKVRVLRSDAYRALLRADSGFDVIVSEPSNPWMAGVEMLYSAEFLEAARERLAPGGVYAQWYHQYETDRTSLDLVLRTYAAVFEHVAIWYGGHSDLLLLGFDAAPSPNHLSRLQRRAETPEMQTALKRSDIGSIAELLAHELMPVGVLHELDLQGPTHTLMRPLLSHQAARAFFRGRVAHLPFGGSGRAGSLGAKRSLLARFIASLPEDQRVGAMRAATLQACAHRRRQCVAYLAAWQAAEPGAETSSAFGVALRGSSLRFGGTIELSLIRELIPLYAASEPQNAAIDFETLLGRTNLYKSFYQHAVPFSRERLLAGWRRCHHPDDPGACARGEALVDGWGAP